MDFIDMRGVLAHHYRICPSVFCHFATEIGARCRSAPN